MGLYSILWNEDINLSGGTAATALALSAGQRGPWQQSTVDIARAPDRAGARIVGLLSACETASAGQGSFTVSPNVRSPYPCSIVNTLLEVDQQWGLNIELPPRGLVGFNGPQGAGAEQSVGVAFVMDPGFKDPWGWQGAQGWDEVIVVQPTTPARVANTASGYTDICGRTTAYTGSQLAIPAKASTKIQVIAIDSRDAAGYSGIGIESPGGEAQLSFPTVATYPTNYDMKELFGAYPTCTADAPFNVYGYGVSTATLTLSRVTLGIKY